jgi:hypothetical protein
LGTGLKVPERLVRFWKLACQHITAGYSRQRVGGARVPYRLRGLALRRNRVVDHALLRIHPAQHEVPKQIVGIEFKGLAHFHGRLVIPAS